MKVNPHKSSTGMDANTLALLSYIAAFVLSWIPIVKWVSPAAPLVIFFIEKGSPFVKFHSMQAFLLNAVSWVISLIISIITSIALASYYNNAFNYNSFSASLGVVSVLGIISVIIAIVLTVFAIIALVKAGGYFEYKLPVLGNLALKWSRKGQMPM